MKKIILVSAIALASTSAFASFDSHAEYFGGVQVGVVKFDSGDADKIKLTVPEVELGYLRTINENHKVHTKVGFGYGESFDNKDGEKYKYQKVDVNSGYQYDFSLSDAVVVSPKASLGYKNEQLKGRGNADGKLTLNRVYADIGVAANIGLSDTVKIQPSVSYGKDLYVKAKADGESWKPKKGDTVKVELGVNAGNFFIAPYHYQYQVKEDGVKTKINETGVKLDYQF